MLKRMIAGSMAAAVVLFAAVLLASDPAGEKKLQQAIDLLETKGDPGRAIPLFEEVSRSADRNLAATALLYMGRAQEKQGGDRARETYQRILRDYSGETAVSTQARRRLGALEGVPRLGIENAEVCRECGDAYSSITPDGRSLLATEWDESGDAALRDLATNRVTRLMAKTGTFETSDEFVEWARLSPDARRLAYLWFTDEEEEGPDSGYQLRWLPVGGKPAVLLKLDGEYEYAEPGGWFDNNSFLVELSKADGTWVLARISVNGSIQPIISLQWRRAGLRGLPAVSPDGRYIAYSALAVNPSRRPTTQSPTPDSKDQYVYVVPSDGLGPERIVARSEGINESPVWTADGKRILFVSDRRQGNRTGVFGLWSVEVQNGQAVGSAPEPLSQHVSGRIRPIGMTRDGSLYYLPDGALGGTDVFLAELQPGGNSLRGAPRRLSEHGADANSAPRWSPDGRFIAFKRRRPPASTGGATANPAPAAFDLIVRDLATGEERAYGMQNPDRPSSNAGLPIWFHDGKAILDGNTTVDLESGATRGIEAIAHSALPLGSRARVLSSDDKILYLALYDQNEKKAVVVTFDMITGEQRRIWSSEAGAATMNLALSPDNRAVAFLFRAKEAGPWKLIRIGVDGTGFRELLSSVRPELNPNFLAWTRDGILFANRSDRIGRIDPEGGAPEFLDLAARPNMEFSPDQKHLLFSDSTGPAGLWALHNLMSIEETK